MKIRINTRNRVIFYTITLAVSMTFAFSQLEANEVIIQKDKNSALSKENMKKTNLSKVDESSKTENLYQTIKRGGPLMIPLTVLLLIALTLVLERSYFFTKYKSWSLRSYEKYMNQAKFNSKSVYKETLNEDLKGQSEVYINRIDRGLSLLSGIGNLAPLFGFFGTVIGMIEAFSDIASASTVNAKVVATGIQVALVTTAGGLSVAVFSLGFFYILGQVVQKTVNRSDEMIVNLAADYPSILNETSSSQS